MSKKIQFQQNIDIISHFFKRPFTLITGILSVLSAFTFSVASYYGAKPLNYTIDYILASLFTESADTYSTGSFIQFFPPILFNVFPVLFGIAFILLYFLCKDDSYTIHKVFKFLKITSLIKAIVSILVGVGVFGIALFVTYIFGNPILLIISSLLLIASAFFVIMNFSRFKFAETINNGATSIYLTKDGCKAFGIFNFICGFFSFISLAFVILTHFVSGIRLCSFWYALRIKISS